MVVFGMPTGRIAVRIRAVVIHSRDKCAGQACCIHNPSDHHMRDWTIILRESTLVERRCPHGIGHPDPDSLAYFERIGVEGMGVHGCDGCCRPARDERKP